MWTRDIDPLRRVFCCLALSAAKLASYATRNPE